MLLIPPDADDLVHIVQREQSAPFRDSSCNNPSASSGYCDGYSFLVHFFQELSHLQFTIWNKQDGGFSRTETRFVREVRHKSSINQRLRIDAYGIVYFSANRFDCSYVEQRL